MGQRINPTLFRLGITRTWQESNFQSRYSKALSQQLKIKQYIKNISANSKGRLTPQKLNTSQHFLAITLNTPPPLPNSSHIKNQLQLLTGVKSLTLTILPTSNPIFSAVHLAQIIARSYEQQTPFLPSLDKWNHQGYGLKVKIKGRIKGIAKAKTLIHTYGTLPLQQLIASIDYGYSNAQTTHGTLGIQVWIYYKNLI